MSVINNPCWKSVLKYNFKKPHFTACTCKFLLGSEGPPDPCLPTGLKASCLSFKVEFHFCLPRKPPRSQLFHLCASLYHNTYIDNIELCVALHHLTGSNSGTEILFHLSVHEQFLDLSSRCSTQSPCRTEMCLTEHLVDRFLSCLYVIPSFSLCVEFFVF